MEKTYLDNIYIFFTERQLDLKGVINVQAELLKYIKLKLVAPL